ncbi:MAG: 3-hydroxyacyl-ACP dehydratase FabZ [Lachnospiraceae bacterium]|nr:3-hydroxyacyl-ACP dehydratase FabZ [Lachnospiraceae bacterium]MDE5781587.1 3-hydroxyacyl-ACP dehydratase FabZ [Lachnospiraceae bacterium]
MLGIKEIQELIPHRHPFLLVDRIDELEPGKRAVGYKCFTYDEWFFKGHFPEQPVVPGVIVIEALAQVGAAAILSLDENKGKIPFFGGISKARFRQKIVPGDRVMLECQIIKQKGPVGVGNATAYVEGKPAVTAEITFAIN